MRYVIYNIQHLYMFIYVIIYNIVHVQSKFNFFLSPILFYNMCIFIYLNFAATP